MTHRIYQMTFESVFKALVAKVERKGGKLQDLYQVTALLTGYKVSEIEAFRHSQSLTYGDFFQQAPSYWPDRIRITGKICGVTIETIEDPLMQEIRRLDKLVDWLAKGKSPEQIIAKYQG